MTDFWFGDVRNVINFQLGRYCVNQLGLFILGKMSFLLMLLDETFFLYLDLCEPLLVDLDLGEPSIL